MTYRHEQGRDLWTGQSLTGRDADDWLHLADELPETETEERLHNESRDILRELAWSILLLS